MKSVRLASYKQVCGLQLGWETGRVANRPERALVGLASGATGRAEGPGERLISPKHSRRSRLVAFFLSPCVGRPAPPQLTVQGHPPNQLDLTIIFSTDFSSL